MHLTVYVSLISECFPNKCIDYRVDIATVLSELGLQSESTGRKFICTLFC